MTTLNLGRNCIGNAGAKAIADPMLRVNKTIRVINLCFNSILADGASFIRESLDCGTNLMKIDLRGNMIGCDVRYLSIPPPLSIFSRERR